MYALSTFLLLFEYIWQKRHKQYDISRLPYCYAHLLIYLGFLTTCTLTGILFVCSAACVHNNGSTNNVFKGYKYDSLEEGGIFFVCSLDT